LKELNEDGTHVFYDPAVIRVLRGGEWTLARYTNRKCVKCGNPLAKDVRSDHCALCRECHSFVGVNYLGIYHKDRRDGLTKGIYGLKGGNEFWANAFGLSLSLILLNEPPILKGHPVLVAVPTHPLDHPDRNYHPPDRLARKIAQHTPATYRPNALKKTAPSEQKSIGGSQERFKHVEHKYKPMEPLVGEQVFIVDDVMTTGATVSTCARCCIEAGASEVHVLVVGRNYKFLEDREYG